MANEYLNNNEFEDLIMEYRETKSMLKDGEKTVRFLELENKLSSAFYAITAGLQRKFKFQLIDSEDIMQEGVWIGFDKINYFKKGKGKAFALYTTIILHHIKQLYRSARNYNELKSKYLDYLCSDKPGMSILLVNGMNRPVIKNQE